MELAEVAVARNFLDCSKGDASPRHGRQASPAKTVRGCFFDANVLEGLCEDVVGTNATNVLVGVIR